MSLSTELHWRGLVNQTTLKDLKELDHPGIKFYLGVDPSADSMTIGHLVPLILAKHLIDHGHKAYLLVGGATGMVGDPDGKVQERDLLTQPQLNANKKKLSAQYRKLMAGERFTLVDNYDWFKNFEYLNFLRQVGKHVPMRQMLAREFVDSRLKGAGISYAEFSYVLIQAYDFYHLAEYHEVSLQISGSDQWGNCIAGVDLIRRKTNKTANVLSTPLVVNKTTGIKFGKTEEGAVWLDPEKTSPTKFYQFWMNLDDDSAIDYLKIYTFLSEEEIKTIISKQKSDPKSRSAQNTLAEQVTAFVHGKKQTEQAKEVTDYLTLKKPLSSIGRKTHHALKSEVSFVKTNGDNSISKALVEAKLASSNGEARQLLNSGAIYINGHAATNTEFSDQDFINGRLLLRKGKAFKDTALVEL